MVKRSYWVMLLLQRLPGTLLQAVTDSRPRYALVIDSAAN